MNNLNGRGNFCGQLIIRMIVQPVVRLFWHWQTVRQTQSDTKEETFTLEEDS